MILVTGDSGCMITHRGVPSLEESGSPNGGIFKNVEKS